MSGDQKIVFEDVSKFYGDVLGVNGVNLSIAPGDHDAGGARTVPAKPR